MIAPVPTVYITKIGYAYVTSCKVKTLVALFAGFKIKYRDKETLSSGKRGMCRKLCDIHYNSVQLLCYVIRHRTVLWSVKNKTLMHFIKHALISQKFRF